MSDLPLSKYYDRADYDLLDEELAIVDQHFHKGSPQSEHRRWEYAMALRALTIWKDGRDYRDPLTIADVGGAGSPFRWMLSHVTHIIDPHEPRNGQTLQNYLTAPIWTDDEESHPMLHQAVFCLSVLEHVDDLDQFFYHLSCLTAPGGLLFLTMDCCGCTDHEPEQDPHHFAAMRKRIFTPDAVGYVEGRLLNRDLTFLGGWSRESYTPQLYGGATDPGYSFASLALVKRS